MTSRPFSDLKADVLALCGIPDGNTQEVARVERFMNMRARKAYSMSQFWPRYLVRGEERTTSEDGLVPYAQDDLETIGTVLRIHATDPFRTRTAAEYGSFAAVSDGIQIAGYVATDSSLVPPITISGSVSPDVAGEYEFLQYDTNYPDLPIWQNTSNTNYRVTPNAVSDTSLQWTVGEFPFGDYWGSDFGEHSVMPWDAENYTGTGGTSGTIEVTHTALYSCFVTYKAAFTGDYDDGDEVPAEWDGFIVRGSFADWLRSEQRSEEAVIAEADARDYIEDELCRISSQNGSDLYTRVLTHGNTQYR